MTVASTAIWNILVVTIHDNDVSIKPSNNRVTALALERMFRFYGYSYDDLEALAAYLGGLKLQGVLSDTSVFPQEPKGFQEHLHPVAQQTFTQEELEIFQSYSPSELKELLAHSGYLPVELTPYITHPSLNV